MTRAPVARLAIGTATIPDEWLVENGYAEWAVTRAARPVFDSTGTTRIGHEDETFARKRPGYNHEVALFHYENGFVPVTRYTAGVAAAQWRYTSKGRKADREAAAQAIAGRTEVAA